MNQPRFLLFGLDDSPTPYFPPTVWEFIRAHRLFSGGRRHHERLRDLLPPDAVWIDIAPPLDDAFKTYAAYEGELIVIFASGDPLFFGFARTLQQRLPGADVSVYPAFHSMQLLAHRLVLPYETLRPVSLTGRPWAELDRALIERAPLIGVLTDRVHTPAALAVRMLDYGFFGYVMHVGEHLGHPDDEHIYRHLVLSEAAGTSFACPNTVLLQACQPLPPRPFGLPDEAFDVLDGRSQLITKAPLRLWALAQLRLGAARTFWDVGFCTGSVSIEARLQFPHLAITAFEVRPEGEQLLAINSRRFGAPGIDVVMGDFLTADLSLLPPPDAVFIGGHGGRLEEMLARIARVLRPGGRVVMNAVLPQSAASFMVGASTAGWKLLPSHRILLDDHALIEQLTAVFE
ncbi:MAG: precorrin-6y C5,15-methyltransferase (decarboxylating) subunit CbiE [Bacteroides sp.]